MTAKSGQTHRPELGPEALHQAEVTAKWRVGEVVLGVHEPNPRVTLQLHCGDVVIQENQRRVGARRRAFNEARFSRRQLVLGPSLLSLDYFFHRDGWHICFAYVSLSASGIL